MAVLCAESTELGLRFIVDDLWFHKAKHDRRTVGSPASASVATRFGFVRLRHGISRTLWQERTIYKCAGRSSIQIVNLCVHQKGVSCGERLSWSTKSWFGVSAWVLVQFTARGLWQSLVKDISWKEVAGEDHAKGIYYDKWFSEFILKT